MNEVLYDKMCLGERLCGQGYSVMKRCIWEKSYISSVMEFIFYIYNFNSYYEPDTQISYI